MMVSEPAITPPTTGTGVGERRDWPTMIPPRSETTATRLRESGVVTGSDCAASSRVTALASSTSSS